MSRYGNREEWLQAAIPGLSALLQADAWGELEEPDGGFPEVRVSVGFPKGRQGRGVAIGQCWDVSCADDRRAQIFIHPGLLVNDSAYDVLGTLLHELVHAFVGVQHGHKAPFAQVCRKVGLEGPPTATHVPVGSWIGLALEALEREVGEYPHARLNDPTLGRLPSGPGFPIFPGGPLGPTDPGKGPPKSGRSLKYVCPADCGTIARMSKTQAARGMVGCKCTGEHLTLVPGD